MKYFILWIGVIFVFIGYSQQLKPTHDFYRVEEKPEFPRGVQELTQYIQSNFKMPYEDYIQKRQGEIFVSFVINKSGYVKQVKLLEALTKH